MLNINIARDFSETPGARSRSDGKYSGEQFREEILRPKYIEASEKNEKLLIDFDGGYGYLISFLEEAFGGLAREFGTKAVLDVLEFKSDEEIALIDRVKTYIENANK